MKSQRIKINCNDYVFIKLTDRGKRIHKENYEKLIGKFITNFPYNPPKENDEGWCEMVLWEIMVEFGAFTEMGSEPCFETTIEFELKQ